MAQPWQSVIQGDVPPARDVWRDNLEFEMCLIREVVDRYPYVSLDVSFLGPVARPIGNFRGPTDFYYQTVRVNVDMLTVLNIGFTFADATGRLAPGSCTWRFNFAFDAKKDMAAREAVEGAANNGIDWEAHRTKGIQVHHFGELLMTSGLVLTDRVRWLSYHSGYEMAFLLKLLSCRALPSEESDFFDLARLYFPMVYDIRFVAKSTESLPNAPQKLLEDIERGRGGVGRPGWIACDPLRVAVEFFKLRQIMLERDFDDSKLIGRLAPLGAT